MVMYSGAPCSKVVFKEQYLNAIIKWYLQSRPTMNKLPRLLFIYVHPSQFQIKI